MDEPVITEELYRQIVYTNRLNGLVFDRTVIVGGRSIEFYNGTKRVKVRHVIDMEKIERSRR